MKEQKSKLRDELFNKYFENQEGIPLIDLVTMLSPLCQKGNEYKKLIGENFEKVRLCMHLYKTIDVIKDNKPYIIIKDSPFVYIVIDVENKKTLDRETITEMFDLDFFISNFVESPTEKEIMEEHGTEWLGFLQDKGDSSKIIDFYYENKKTLFAHQESIVYGFKINDAQTNLIINLINDKIQLHFTTPDQFLYEHIFFAGDLTPSGLQDAHDKIGLERMLEMMSLVKDIKIPSDLIDPELLKTNVLPQTSSEKVTPYKKTPPTNNK